MKVLSLGLGSLVAAVTVPCVRRLRRWMAQWGATPSEVAAHLPGDEVISHGRTGAVLGSSRAATEIGGGQARGEGVPAPSRARRDYIAAISLLRPLRAGMAGGAQEALTDTETGAS